MMQLDGTVFWVSMALVSTVFFRALRHVVGEKIPMPKKAKENRRVTEWQWRNICVSLVHSCFGGICGPLCFYVYPEMTDMINNVTPMATVVIVISTGYFIDDLIDICQVSTILKEWELKLHHLLVLSCFFTSITTQLYSSYGVMALLAEVNSIFLHTRLLLKFSGLKETIYYQINIVLNLISFFIFRVGTFGWMIWWIVNNGHRVPMAHAFVGYFSLTLITIFNAILFYRLLLSDLIQRRAIKTSKFSSSVHEALSTAATCKGE